MVARDLDVIGARIAAYLQLARQFAGAGHLTATRQQLDDVAGLLPDLEALCGAVHAHVNPAGFDDDAGVVLDNEDTLGMYAPPTDAHVTARTLAAAAYSSVRDLQTIAHWPMSPEARGIVDEVIDYTDRLAAAALQLAVVHQPWAQQHPTLCKECLAPTPCSVIRALAGEPA